MSIIVWIIFGAFAGWIASLVDGTSAKQGIATNIIIGIVGAFLGGWLMQSFEQSTLNGFSLYSVFVAILGAVLLLSGYRLIFGESRVIK